MPFYYRHHGKPAPNAYVAFVRQIYNPLGFYRGYNFPLWFITAGAALGFCASRAMYLNFDSTYLSAKWVTGDGNSQSMGKDKVGMLLHLACVIPIGFLIPWQFLPIIRHKLLLFHRINGYLLIILLLGGNAGAMMVTRYCLGGDIAMQTMMGLLAIVTTLSAFLAYVSIKRLQIDQHRAWMLRCWVYAFSIITTRIVQIPAYQIVSTLGTFYIPIKCTTIDGIWNNPFSTRQPPNRMMSAQYYPECAQNPDGWAAVKADYYAAGTRGPPPIQEIGASITVVFSVALIVAFFLHAVGIEIYLKLTPAEAARLKRVSKERQAQRGWKHPGDAGWLTVETWGDAEEFDHRDRPEMPIKTASGESTEIEGLGETQIKEFDSAV